jgi:hypothetical protein
MRRNTPRALAVAALLAPLAGCDLTEVELADLSDVLVAEVYVTLSDQPADSRVRAFIHGTGGGAPPSSQAFDDATVTVTDDDGTQWPLALSVVADCVRTRPEGSQGSCFVASSGLTASLRPGEALEVRVALSDGRALTGETRMPGAFALAGVTTGAACRATPDTRVPRQWTLAEGASAYVSEAFITGLPAALAGEGIEAPDTVYLLGLSISETDTTVEFPNEFGVFERFDLDRDLAVRLQDGLPGGARAGVAITAVERNYVNWVRGGDFNPSGQVRSSSLTGDGSGVFGAAVTRQFEVVSTTDPSAGPPCP